ARSRGASQHHNLALPDGQRNVTQNNGLVRGVLVGQPTHACEDRSGWHRNPYIKAAGSMRCNRRLANQADKAATRIVSPPTASTPAVVSSKSRRVPAPQIA